MKRILVCAAAHLLVVAVYAAPITPGNLVIYRVGDGIAALGTTAAAVFLDEYTPLGGFVQSIPLPSSGASALTAVGNATTEGIMSFSQNGSTVIFTGYRKDVGGTNPSSDAPATTPRVIGTLNPSTGLFDTSIALTDSTLVIRSATSTDGASLFYAGTSAGVRYVGSPGPAATSVLIDTRNSRQVLLDGNVLFASNGSTGTTNKVQHYGTLPIGTTTPTAVVTLATTDAVNGFALFDLSASVAGADTLYALSTVESRLRKYTYDGTSWTASGFISSTAADLNGIASGGTVSLFLTSGSTLFGLTDSSGYGGTLGGSPTTLALAGGSTAFRGIIPTIPEPGAFAMLGLGLAGLAFWRRRR